MVFSIVDGKNKIAGLWCRLCGAVLISSLLFRDLENGKTRCGATPERVCNAIQSAALSAVKNQFKY
ncbi:hypothetical protein CPter91_1126 [Collimonas pratensis]|uniref:Uncharacterized protein n=1 Tax=Collimonas pratensis TaxID=279113 RepID=A0A127Q0F5_9BURK|nr:hypothetical protein CPter91_1126 [Collimonas pratensis]